MNRRTYLILAPIIGFVSGYLGALVAIKVMER